MTLIQKEIKAVYLWETKVRPSTQPITTAWIYHNSDLWLISLSSDWSNWITIADKNLWATTVYTNWDTLSEANCWKFYQWGNNYWFAWSGSLTTSSSQVNASSYWPNNYYSDATWRTSTTWDSSNNTNLRWDDTNTNAARKWPCDTWFHIPSLSEWSSLNNLWITLWAWTNSNWTALKKNLKLPLAWLRNYSNASVADTNSYGNYWSTWYTWTNNAYYFYFNASSIHTQWAYYRSDWFSIRPFKNEAVQPREWEEWTNVYPWSLLSFNEIAAMALSNSSEAAAELNSHSTEYFNKFSTEWKLWYYSSWWYYYMSSDWTQSWRIRTSEGRYMCYYTNLTPNWRDSR